MLNGGAIVETGTHDDLLEQKGLYAEMWEKQIHAEQAVLAAREAKLKAARALRRADMPAESTSSGEDNHDHDDQSPTSSFEGSATNSDDESTHSREETGATEQLRENERRRQNELLGQSEQLGYTEMLGLIEETGGNSSHSPRRDA